MKSALTREMSPDQLFERTARSTPVSLSCVRGYSSNMAPGTLKRSILTLISFYLFNGNLLLICHSCCSKSGHFGKMVAFTVGRVTSYLIKAWGARGGTHLYDYGNNPGTYYGGKGAFKAGKFRLNRGILANL